VKKGEEQSDAESSGLSSEKTREETHCDREHEIRITAKNITIPDWLEINDWGKNVLEILRERPKVSSDAGVDWNVPRSRDSEATAVSHDEGKAEPKV